MFIISSVRTKAEFAKFINGKFLEWQIQEGERKLLKDFAQYLGINAPTLSMWMSGERLPSDFGTVQRLAAKLGDEIFDILAIGDVNPLLRLFMASIEKLNQHDQDAIRRRLESAVARENNGIENEHRTTNPR